MPGKPKPNIRKDLHDMLDSFLSIATETGSDEQTSLFWLFVSEVACGHGIAEHLHRTGDYEVSKVQKRRKESQEDFEERKRRAFDIGVLARLMSDVQAKHHEGGHPHFFPEEFRFRHLPMDLYAMLGSHPEVPAGQPEVLYSIKKGKQHARKANRRTFVLAVHYRAAEEDKKPRELLSRCGARDLNEQTWRDWINEVGAKPIAAVEAKGRAGDLESAYNLSDRDIEHRYKIARGRHRGKG